MDFTINTKNLLNTVSKMKGLVDAIKEISPNVRISKNKKDKSIIIEYIGTKSYSIGKIDADIKKWDDDYSFITEAKYLSHLPQQFDSCQFMLNSNGDFIDVIIDDNNLNLVLPIKTCDFNSMVPQQSETEIHFDKKDLDTLKSVIKFVPDFTYKGDSQASVQFTVIRFIIENKILKLYMSDGQNLLFKKFILSDNFKGKDIILFIPAKFFINWNSFNIDNSLDIGVNETSITIKDADGLIGVHDTLSGKGFIDIESAVTAYSNDKSTLSMKIDANSLLKNLQYAAAVEFEKDVITLDIGKKPKIIVHGKENHNHERNLDVGKEAGFPIVKIEKNGVINLNYENFVKCLKASSELVQGGIVNFDVIDNKVYFVNNNVSFMVLTSCFLAN